MASPFYMNLDRVRIQIDRYAVPIILFVGNVFNLANLYIFSRRNMRVHACAWYFMCLSFAHILLLDIHGIPKVVVAWTGYDYATYNIAYCKIRAYFFTLSMVLSRQFICLISIDRWLVTSSSAWLRSQSSLRMARLLIVISVGFWCIYDIHALIGYQSNGFGCYPPSLTTYSSFAAIDTIVTTLFPSVIMIVFSILALHNLRSRAVHRIYPVSIQTSQTGEKEKQKSRRDIQLIRLSLLQVLIFTLLNAPWTTFAIFAMVAKVDTYGFFNYILINSFLNGFAATCLFIYGSTTFIIYTLASNTFRMEFKVACQKWWNRMNLCHQ